MAPQESSFSPRIREKSNESRTTGEKNFRKWLEPAIFNPETFHTMPKELVLSRNCHGQYEKRKFLTKFSGFYGVLSQLPLA
jgi:hypothetical protein